MTTGAQLIFLEPGLAAGALENMSLRLQFRLCGSVAFGGWQVPMPAACLSPSSCCRAASRNFAQRRACRSAAVIALRPNER